MVYTCSPHPLWAPRNATLPQHHPPRDPLIPLIFPLPISLTPRYATQKKKKRQTKRKFVTVIVVVIGYTLPTQSRSSQTKNSAQTLFTHSLPLKGGAGILKTGNPPVPLLPDRVVFDRSTVVADLSPDVADPPPIVTFLATACSCASLTR